MARYRFTARDLAPLRPLLDAPFAREVLETAIPIKRFASGARQREEIELPVAVQSREEPDGVPLPDILKAVQAEVPGVTGIAVRRGKAVLTNEAPLTAEQKRKIERLLRDRRRLMGLRPAAGSDLAPEDPAALRKVLQGGKYITPSLAEQIVYSFESDANHSPHENLSDREYQVMCLIASGKTVKEIAEQLFLSVKTVSTYRARVLEKMRLKNNSELTTYAIKNRLVN